MASLNPFQGNLGHRRAAHLLRRTSFHFTKTKVDLMAGQNIQQALAPLLQLNPFNLEQPIYDDLAVTGTDIKTWCLPYGLNNTNTEDFKYRSWLVAWWTREALLDQGIGHKMTLFFHQFMQSTVNSYRTDHYFDYLALIRWAALGNFKKLSTKIIFDNVMLRYLNNTQNVKNNPNENFAREYLELFTIGKGEQVAPGDYTNYTEDDIVAAAKVFTGIKNMGQRNIIDPETGIPKGGFTNQNQYNNNHDITNKQFSSRFQGINLIQGATTLATHQNEIDAFVNMVFEQPETAKNLCRRLYRFFVGPNINTEIEEDIIVPLSNLLIDSNFEVLPVLEKLLQSEHFFDADDSNTKDELIGSIIKSPLEITHQSLSFFGTALPDPMTQTKQYFDLFSRALNQRIFNGAGFPLLYTNDVAGYPAYYQHPDYSRAWFNSSTIIARYKWSAVLLSGNMSFTGGNAQTLGTRLNIAPWTKDSGFFSNPEDAQTLVEELLKYLLAETVDADRFNYFLNTIFLDNLPASDWTYEWQAYLTTNNDSEVKIALGRLVNAIMYSPEYQTL